MDAKMRELLKDIKVCFCTLCKHSQDFGHCYFCPCHNNLPQPVLTGDAVKVKVALDHAVRLMREIAKEHPNG